MRLLALFIPANFITPFDSLSLFNFAVLAKDEKFTHLVHLHKAIYLLVSITYFKPIQKHYLKRIYGDRER